MHLPPEPPDEGDEPIRKEMDGIPEEPDEDLGHDNVIMLPGLGGGPSLFRPSLVQGLVQEAPAEGADEPGIEEGPEPGELGPPEPHLLEGAVEALLLAADGPVQELELERWLGGPGLEPVRSALYTIQDRLRRGHGGIRLVQVAKGWQLRTDVRFAPWVAAMRGGRPVKLTRAALETLSIVAYRQPCTRGEIEELRGVDSGGVLRMLAERNLVAITGRKDAPGRPLIYSTTSEFLAMFSLRDLSDLPTLRDLRELRLDDPREGPGGTDDGSDFGESEDSAEIEPAPRQAPPRPPSLLPPDPDDLPEGFEEPEEDPDDEA